MSYVGDIYIYMDTNVVILMDNQSWTLMESPPTYTFAYPKSATETM